METRHHRVALIPLLPLAGFIVTLLLGKRCSLQARHISAGGLVTVSAVAQHVSSFV